MRFAVSAAVRLSSVGEVVGEGDDADEALRLVGRLKPDLVVLDLRLKGETDGIELCRALKSLPAPPRVLVHTSFNAPADLELCLLAGADGFVHKSATHEELVKAIRAACAGDAVRLVGDENAGRKPPVRRPEDPADTPLTAREREVWTLALRGRSNKQIAHELEVSVPTVKTHMRNILKKRGAKKRWEFFSQ
jgi:DNA-binding NarL/FixJ family response regulator